MSQPWVQISVPKNMSISIEDRADRIVAACVNGRKWTSRARDELRAALMNLLEPFMNGVRVYVYFADDRVNVHVFEGPKITDVELEILHAERGDTSGDH